MAIEKCRICNNGFRTSKARETLCPSCEVNGQPKPNDPEKVEEEFNNIAVQIYGEDPAKPINLNDVFSHESRLKALHAKLENIKDLKEQTRQKREISRLVEEHKAVQKKLVDMQSRLFQGIMFTSATKSSPSRGSKTSPVSSPIRYSDRNNNTNGPKSDAIDSVKITPLPDNEPHETPQKIEEEILLASPVKQTALFFEMAAKRSAADEITLPPKKTQNPAPIVQISKILDTVTEGQSLNHTPSAAVRETEEPEPEVPLRDDFSDEESAPQLTRSNSVRNRIKAFEAISRRASTGSWDRKPTPKKTLKF